MTAGATIESQESLHGKKLDCVHRPLDSTIQVHWRVEFFFCCHQVTNFIHLTVVRPVVSITKYAYISQMLLSFSCRPSLR
ncbi:hypothetical protein [Bacillus pumilus]|uniref:hypothetical protein n=1 Tax=Bacillus pumilus TaxID=1408 RepID=UPI003CE6C916